MSANRILRELVAATREAGRIVTNVLRTSVKLSSQSTSALCGVAGGTFGIATAYALSLLTDISLPVVSTILCTLGIVTGILAYRGRSRIGMDSRMEQNRIATEEVLRRIKKLPADTPDEVRAELWQTFRHLNSTAQFLEPRVPPPAIDR